MVLPGLRNEQPDILPNVKKQSFVDTIPSSTKTNSDTTVRISPSGFYLLTPDTSKSQGVQPLYENEYYFLDSIPIIPIIYVDSVNKKYDKYNNGFELVFTFNHTGTRIWAEFTLKNISRRVGLVINNQLLNAPTIQGQIPNGISSLTLPYSEKQIDDLKTVIDKEINRVKGEAIKGYR
jgi:preprotein translocase subunit SecD